MLSISSVLSALPGFIVSAALLTALVFTLAWKARLGRAAPFAIAGLGLLLLTELLGVLFQVVGVPMILRNAGSSSEVGYVFAAQGLIAMALRLAGLGLLVVAVFAGRPKPQPAAFTGHSGPAWPV